MTRQSGDPFTMFCEVSHDVQSFLPPGSALIGLTIQNGGQLMRAEVGLKGFDHPLYAFVPCFCATRHSVLSAIYLEYLCLTNQSINETVYPGEASEDDDLPALNNVVRYDA